MSGTRRKHDPDDGVTPSPAGALGLTLSDLERLPHGDGYYVTNPFVANSMLAPVHVGQRCVAEFTLPDGTTETQSGTVFDAEPSLGILAGRIPPLVIHAGKGLTRVPTAVTYLNEQTKCVTLNEGSDHYKAYFGPMSRWAVIREACVREKMASVLFRVKRGVFEIVSLGSGLAVHTVTLSRGFESAHPDLFSSGGLSRQAWRAPFWGPSTDTVETAPEFNQWPVFRYLRNSGPVTPVQRFLSDAVVLSALPVRALIDVQPEGVQASRYETALFTVAILEDVVPGHSKTYKLPMPPGVVFHFKPEDTDDTLSSVGFDDSESYRSSAASYESDPAYVSDFAPYRPTIADAVDGDPPPGESIFAFRYAMSHGLSRTMAASVLVADEFHRIIALVRPRWERPEIQALLLAEPEPDEHYLHPRRVAMLAWHLIHYTQPPPDLAQSLDNFSMTSLRSILLRADPAGLKNVDYSTEFVASEWDFRPVMLRTAGVLDSRVYGERFIEYELVSAMTAEDLLESMPGLVRFADPSTSSTTSVYPSIPGRFSGSSSLTDSDGPMSVVSTPVVEGGDVEPVIVGSATLPLGTLAALAVLQRRYLWVAISMSGARENRSLLVHCMYARAVTDRTYCPMVGYQEPRAALAARLGVAADQLHLRPQSSPLPVSPDRWALMILRFLLAGVSLGEDVVAIGAGHGDARGFLPKHLTSFEDPKTLNGDGYGFMHTGTLPSTSPLLLSIARGGSARLLALNSMHNLVSDPVYAELIAELKSPRSLSRFLFIANDLPSEYQLQTAAGLVSMTFDGSVARHSPVPVGYLSKFGQPLTFKAVGVALRHLLPPAVVSAFADFRYVSTEDFVLSSMFVPVAPIQMKATVRHAPFVGAEEVRASPIPAVPAVEVRFNPG